MPTNKRNFQYVLPEALLQSKDKEEIENFVKNIIVENSKFITNGFKNFVSPEELKPKFQQWKIEEETQAKVQIQIETDNKKLASKIVGKEFVDILVAAVPLSKEDEGNAKVITKKYNLFVEKNPALQKVGFQKSMEELTKEVREVVKEEQPIQDYFFTKINMKGK